MSQREPASRRPREGDLEKNLRPEYKEYEAWRAAQTGGATSDAVVKKEEPKKFRLGRMDFILALLGFLAVMVYQSCRGGTPQ